MNVQAYHGIPTERLRWIYATVSSLTWSNQTIRHILSDSLLFCSDRTVDVLYESRRLFSRRAVSKHADRSLWQIWYQRIWRLPITSQRRTRRLVSVCKLLQWAWKKIKLFLRVNYSLQVLSNLPPSMPPPSSLPGHTSIYESSYKCIGSMYRFTIVDSTYVSQEAKQKSEGSLHLQRCIGITDAILHIKQPASIANL